MRETLQFIKQLFCILIWRDGLTYLRYKLLTYGLVRNKKYAYLKQYYNKHKGERCFIVATGPSLTYADLELIKDEISFGVNSTIKILGKTNWCPTYYGIQDPFVYEKLEDDIVNSRLDEIFVGSNITNKFPSSLKFKPFFGSLVFILIKFLENQHLTFLLISVKLFLMGIQSHILCCNLRFIWDLRISIC